MKKIRTSPREERLSASFAATAPQCGGSQLWTGTLRFSDWTITDRGTVDDFPRWRKGKRKYRTLEGLCWLSANSFVMVSDLAKAGYSKRCRKHDQSIHVFRLPKV